MGAKHTYANVLPSCTGGSQLALEVGLKDGRLFFGSYPIDEPTRDLRCVLDVDDARLLIKGLQEAIAALKQ